MLKKIALVLVLVLTVLSLGIASAGSACPPKSKNPGGTPPNCGHGPEKADECVENGVASGTVRTYAEPLDPTGGHDPKPDQGGIVHRVNCTVVDRFLHL